MSGDAPSPKRRATLLLLAAGLGVAGILGFAASAPRFLVAGSVGLAVAGAASASAALLGFLFGVPRKSTADVDGEQPAYLPNTNLEQVSDWLTKLLLGATLTQVGRIVSFFEDVFASVGAATQHPGGAAFVGLLATYSASVGFVAGWLATRLLLGRLMKEADDHAQLLRMAGDAAASGNDALARDLTTIAVSKRGASDSWSALARLAARDYERLRADQPSGWERTRQLAAMYAASMEVAQRAGESITATEVAQLFDTGEQGDRITALAYMQARPDLVDLVAVAEAIRAPRSAFEQYHALKVAQGYLGAADTVDDATVMALRPAVEEALASGDLERARDRRVVAEAVLARLRRE